MQSTPRNHKRQKFAVVFNSEYKKPSCFIPCLGYLCGKEQDVYIYPYESSGKYKVKDLSKFIEKDLKNNDFFDRDKKLKFKKAPSSDFLNDEDVINIAELQFDSKLENHVIFGFQIK